MKVHELGEQTFRQGDYMCGHEVATKPTTIGGTLQLQLPEHRNARATTRESGSQQDSKALARWNPGMMRAVAQACLEQVFKKDYKIKQLTWRQHVEAGHTPFRRDCRICQEASAKARPHRSVPHPLCGVLSVDFTGPLCRSLDDGVWKRYILVGNFTWMKPEGAEIPTGPNLAPVAEDQLPLGPKEGEAEEEGLAEDEGVAEDEGLAEEGLAEDEGRAEERGLADDAPPAEEKQGDEEGHNFPRPAEVVSFRLAIPTASRQKNEVVEALHQMYIQLRIMGYPVTRLHSDRGPEFLHPWVRDWCRNRNIIQTTTAGYDSQANGRAERAIQEVKMRIRRALAAAGWEQERWADACHFVHQVERRRMMYRPSQEIPGFGEEVLVKKRIFHGSKARDLEPSHEKVRYLYPVPEGHGHAVRHQDGRVSTAAYFIAKTKEPPEAEETWIALVAKQCEDEDPIGERRRIRGKMAVRSVNVLHSGEEDEEERLMMVIQEQKEEAAGRHARIVQVLEEEGGVMISDEVEVMDIVFNQLAKMKQMVQQKPEEVLRTRIVSPQELLQEADLWDAPIREELTQLVEGKNVLRCISGEELRQLQKGQKTVEVVPSKMVLTLKPGPRRRARMVGCGNFVKKQEGEDLYAGGADTVALRYVLKRGAEEGWAGVTMDIKAAFLNAPLYQAGLEETIVVLKPPHLLIRLGYVQPDEHFLVEKAMYGLRQSPKSWGLHRDAELIKMRSSEGRTFVPSVGDPNLWRVIRCEVLEGFLLVYVDDFLVMMKAEGIPDVLKVISDRWEISAPEFLEKQKVKFLGMELERHPLGFVATQENYIRDKKEPVVRKVRIPIAKDQMPDGNAEVTESSVRRAQQHLGELLWLATRTRPEICYAVAKCSQVVLSHPDWVTEQAEHIWAYLRSTPAHGLLFTRERGVGWGTEDGAGLEVYTDVSFAPGGVGSASHGCVMVCWNKSLLFWRSGRQSFPTLSTAEAELMETIEGLTLGDSVEALLQEHEDWCYRRTLFTDNQATVTLLEGSGNGWRTRHLRLRSEHLKWRVTSLDWRIRHLPGSVMIADLGTKVLPIQRFEELKVLMNMSMKELEEAVETAVDGRLMKLVLLFSLLGRARGHVEEIASDSGWDAWEFFWIMLIYTAFVISVTWWCARKKSEKEPEVGAVPDNAQRELMPEDRVFPVQRDAVDEPVESIFSQSEPELRRVFVTSTGEKFHEDVKCSGLSAAKTLMTVEGCSQCVVEGFLEGTIYVKSQKFHVCAHCSNGWRKRYRPCSLCVQVSEGFESRRGS